MNDKKQLMFLAAGLVFLAGLFVMARLARRDSGGGMPVLALERVGGGEPVRLDSCPTAKCLTVIVAPWCGICRSSTGFLGAFAAYLKGRGVESRVVVSQGSASDVASYAKEFGPDTLMDPGGSVPAPGGVPNFVVTDGTGKALRRMPGVPGLYQPPYKEDILRGFAVMLGL
ncbi:MAG: redoxin family protein [Elusimicrobiota bacterium]